MDDATKREVWQSIGERLARTQDQS
jgi:predicted Fe-S protein YdhL (DUF1289 family)